jgi:hypothetical protein
VRARLYPAGPQSRQPDRRGCPGRRVQENKEQREVGDILGRLPFGGAAQGGGGGECRLLPEEEQLTGGALSGTKPVHALPTAAASSECRRTAATPTIKIQPNDIKNYHRSALTK